LSSSSDRGEGLRGQVFRVLGPVSEVLERFSFIRILLATLRHFQRQSCTARSAEIAYWAILSSIPFGALLLTGLGLAATELLESGWTQTELHTAVAEVISTYMPTAIPELDATLTWLLGGKQALGLFGAGALLLTASLVFGAVSRSLTSIFGVKGRDRYTTTVLFTVGLCALAIVVILGLPALSALAPYIALYQGPSIAPLWLHALADTILALAFIFLLSAVARASVSWWLMWTGALLYVALFEIARVGFSFYLGSLSKMHIIYGSFVGVMALIIWTYVVALLLLVTMCLVRVLRDRLHETSLGVLLEDR
jgi:membrane protein